MFSSIFSSKLFNVVIEPLDFRMYLLTFQCYLNLLIWEEMNNRYYIDVLKTVYTKGITQEHSYLAL